MSSGRGLYFWVTAACATIVVLGVAPFVSLFLGLGLASILGCNVSEGGITACPVIGIDLGETLLTMVMLGWLGVAALPAVAVAAAVWLVAWVLHRWQRRHQT